MSGLNHVDPGGEPLILPLSPSLTMTKLSVGPMDNNAYLLTSADGGRLLVDAAADTPRLLAVTASSLDTIVTTHRHADHWQALSDVAEATGAALHCGRPDVHAIATGAWVENLTGLWDGDTVTVGDQVLDVIGLVGHTPGSIALAYEGADGVAHLFTGDSLFPGGPGKTSGPADFTSLLDDLERGVFARFDDRTVVHPGHGDDTTLGAERPHLPEWRARGW
ncbi:MBL fold metallo-hydrolase [uncultured Friedmanniella sp.]|uniref:MBL fold metallo-hydrolase n=1 Tax=uncultured Friedmanniella sp. TaxID=335381 RepID=UPI0035CADB84